MTRMHSYLAPSFLILLSVGNAHAQSWNWATPIMGTGQQRVGSVAALADGGALVCGEFNDTLRTATDTIVTHGDWDGFLGRLDNTGAFLWIIAIGGDQYDELNDIVVDADGNGFAAATFSDTAHWSSTEILGGIGREAALVKFDLNGNVQWYKRAAGNSYAYTVSVSSIGRAFLGGVLNASAVFSGTTLTNSAGIFNAYVIQYNAISGALIDADMVSSSSGDFGAFGMDVDADGNVYFTGYSRPQQNPYVSTFMAKVAFGSGTSWSNTVSSAFGDLYGRDVSVTNDGHVYFTGNIYNNVTWMGSPLGQYGRYKNAYLARFTTGGTLDWVQQVGFTSSDEGLGVVADGLGNAYWTGMFGSQADFDTIHVDCFPGVNSQDVFVAYTGPAGGAAFVSTAGGYGDEQATAIDKQVDGPVIVGGTYSGFPYVFGDSTFAQPQGHRLFIASLAGPDDDLATGIASTPSDPPLQVYPVPASDVLFIALNGARGALTWSVIDQRGRSVLNSKLNTPFGAIDIRELAPGLYSFRCADEEGRIGVQRFVVVR